MTNIDIIIKEVNGMAQITVTQGRHESTDSEEILADSLNRTIQALLSVVTESTNMIDIKVGLN